FTGCRRDLRRCLLFRGAKSARNGHSRGPWRITGRSAEACDRKNHAPRPGWTRSRWGRGTRAYARVGELALRYKPDGSGDVGHHWGVARGGGAPGLLSSSPARDEGGSPDDFAL